MGNRWLIEAQNFVVDRPVLVKSYYQCCVLIGGATTRLYVRDHMVRDGPLENLAGKGAGEVQKKIRAREN